MIEICNGSKSVIFTPKYQAQRCPYLTGHNSKKCTATYDFLFAVLVKGHLSPCNRAN